MSKNNKEREQQFNKSVHLVGMKKCIFGQYKLDQQMRVQQYFMSVLNVITLLVKIIDNLMLI